MTLDAFSAWMLGPGPDGTLSWRRCIAAVALAVAGAVVAFLRLPAPSRSVLWAEDAQVFVTGALADRPFGALFDAYAGYMHAFPRIATLIATQLVPLHYLPLAITAIACSLTGFVASLAFVLLRPRMPSVLPRLAVWLGIAALPIAGLQVNGSIANSHWYLLTALFLALVTRQRQGTLIVVSSITTALAVLSDPLSLVFAPLAILAVMTTKSRRELCIPLVYFGNLVLQFTIAATTSTGQSPQGQPTLGQLARATGFRVFLTGTAGETGSVALYTALGVGTLTVATLVVLLLVAFSVAFGNQLGGLAVAGFAWATVFFIVAIYIRWGDIYDPALSLAWASSRYSVVPTTLIVIIAACAVATVDSRGKRGWLARVVLFAWIAWILVPAFSITSRTPASPWYVALTSAISTCEQDPTGSLTIPTVPEHWGVHVTCAHLLIHR